MNIYLPDPLDRFRRYVTALTELGAVVRSDAPEECAGLLLPGGGDIDPRLYGQENHGSKGVDEARDERELAALRLFVSRGLPVLGICRGAQLVNVFFGGTLHQDISGHDPIGKQDRIHGSHTEDAALRALYGERFPVNSAHHQSIDRLGDGLRAVQRADDGTIEAVRHEALPVFAVQWHPERLRAPIDGWRLLAQWLSDIER